MTKSAGTFWSWFLQRITAIILTVGLFVHFFVLHFTVERPLTFEKVFSRLSSPGWVIFDLCLLACAVYHALNGIWAIINDYAPPENAKKIIFWVLFILGAVTFSFGAFVLLPFTG